MTDIGGHLLSSYLDTYFITYSISLPPTHIYIDHLHVNAIQNWFKQNYLRTLEKVDNDTVVLWSAQNLLTTFHLCFVFTHSTLATTRLLKPTWMLICIMTLYRLRSSSPLLGPLSLSYHPDSGWHPFSWWEGGDTHIAKVQQSSCSWSILI